MLELNAEQPLGSLLAQIQISTWEAFLVYLKKLPYGRNANREDLSLVITEAKGTCSSKHALAKAVADENALAGVQLVLCLYKMNAQNTPGIGTVLEGTTFSFIPEAHCYLEWNGQALDVTHPTADLANIRADILKKEYISPAQVNRFKVEYHQQYLKDWLANTASDWTFDALWKLRERCIQNLSQHASNINF